jgi:hypothetical protein
MFVKTLHGELIVAGKRGLIGENISMVSICLPFPKGRANWRRFKNLRIFCRSVKKGRIEKYSQRHSFELSPPPLKRPPRCDICGKS